MFYFKVSRLSKSSTSFCITNNEQIYSSSKASDFYSEGAWFEILLIDQTFELRGFVTYSSPPGKFREKTLNLATIARMYIPSNSQHSTQYFVNS